MQINQRYGSEYFKEMSKVTENQTNKTQDTLQIRSWMAVSWFKVGVSKRNLAEETMKKF